ncbi:MAG: amphi-Trp domain-containing protein [Nitrospinae bacterium]|nr:amphi-Trp domain-containing protein [Nitrospinota bacterium]
MSKENEFNYDAELHKDAVVRYLGALVEGFGSGKLTMGSKDRQLSMEPAGLIKVEVEAKRKDGKAKLKLSFSWRDEKKPSAEDGIFIKSGAVE